MDLHKTISGYFHDNLDDPFIRMRAAARAHQLIEEFRDDGALQTGQFYWPRIKERAAQKYTHNQ